MWANVEIKHKYIFNENLQKYKSNSTLNSWTITCKSKNYYSTYYLQTHTSECNLNMQIQLHSFIFIFD